TKGKTFAEYSAEAFADVLNNPEFQETYDGFYFDTFPPHCCYLTQTDLVDYNFDGIPDGCVSGVCALVVENETNEWVVNENARTQEFFATLFAAKGEGQYITTGQDWLTGPNRVDSDGWKLEGWLLQDTSQNDYKWITWWNGSAIGTPGGVPGLYAADQI